MITFTHLSKSYDAKGIAGVNDVSFSLTPGKILAVLGPNGSGKTTLLGLVQEATSLKTVLVENKVQLSEETVLEFLLHCAPEDLSSEKKVQLARDFASLFEFTFQLKQKTTELSAGQMQKVYLSSLLLRNPEILLLDEPFSHLDPFTRRDILSQLFVFLRNQDTAVLWVTHDRNEALEYADQIALLNFGKIEQLGTPEEIVFQPKNLFAVQFMGYRNVVPVSRQDLAWKTPWGEWQTHSQGTLKEALMVIPQGSFDASPGRTWKVVERTLQNLTWVLKVEKNDLAFWVEVPGNLGHETKLELSPRYTECFLIPL